MSSPSIPFDIDSAFDAFDDCIARNRRGTREAEILAGELAALKEDPDRGATVSGSEGLLIEIENRYGRVLLETRRKRQKAFLAEQLGEGRSRDEFSVFARMTYSGWYVRLVNDDDALEVMLAANKDVFSTSNDSSVSTQVDYYVLRLGSGESVKADSITGLVDHDDCGWCYPLRVPLSAKSIGKHLVILEAFFEGAVVARTVLETWVRPMRIRSVKLPKLPDGRDAVLRWESDDLVNDMSPRVYEEWLESERPGGNLFVEELPMVEVPAEAAPLPEPSPPTQKEKEKEVSQLLERVVVGNLDMLKLAEAKFLRHKEVTGRADLADSFRMVVDTLQGRAEFTREDVLNNRRKHGWSGELNQVWEDLLAELDRLELLRSK